MCTQARSDAVQFPSRRIPGLSPSATTHEVQDEPDDQHPYEDAEPTVTEEQVQEVGEGNGMNHAAQDRVRAAPSAQKPAAIAAATTAKVKRCQLRFLEARRMGARTWQANPAQRDGQRQSQTDQDRISAHVTRTAHGAGGDRTDRQVGGQRTAAGTGGGHLTPQRSAQRSEGHIGRIAFSRTPSGREVDRRRLCEQRTDAALDPPEPRNRRVTGESARLGQVARPAHDVAGFPSSDDA